MAKEIIHFSHANGFPAGVYRKLWAALGDDYDVRAIERIGHDPRYPVTPEWRCLRDELVDTLTREYTEPVWLVGHSLGGFLSLMAALKAPRLVRGVVMIDSPLVAPGWRAQLLRLGLLTGLYERLSPAGVTKNRRMSWPDWDAAWSHFAGKPAFARWDEDVLHDYIDHGTHLVGAGPERTLAFRREIEYRIYLTLPRRLGARAARGVPVPVGFLAGTRSRELRQVGLAATRKIVGEHLRYIRGSHLFPMERPVETAAALRSMLADLRGDRTGRGRAA
ncbi:2-succinyl-6-hydroxy-2, 4-cyclohexadiene-1-carboxylate synthase [Pandoraea terrae]|uniref:2-succinyl-6-hydroxy-2, 4-cyclohexadiene-1-carboxylate synthase n=1 Tax=Pandoraea terrae TaxID=1537710 RepID=A0A5E4VTB6_9BURK|nr:alpha/beta hydrolase [Pandoraea terrae]VVE14320.1 2-succinyl-6-hydroxy-2, 4-cyclohexadiene-1-carboxylate synthase [Pandoraea terrae]